MSGRGHRLVALALDSIEEDVSNGNRPSTSQLSEISQDEDITSANMKPNKNQFSVLEDDPLLSDSDDSVADKDYNPIHDLDSDSEDNFRQPNIPVESKQKIKRKVSRESVIQQIGKKRTRHVSEWVVNKRKRDYAAGRSYVAKSGKEVPYKKKAACSCRLKCYSKITEEKRDDIFNYYWDEEKDYDVKRQFILSCVETKPTARQRLRSGDESKSRKNTLVYALTVDGVKTVVCKCMFLNTLGISQTVVKTALRKRQEGGIVMADKRGKHTPSNKTQQHVIDSIVSHISTFPKYESHYNRERSNKAYLGPHLSVEKMYMLYKEYCSENQVHENDIAKLWLYRDIFNTKFNFTFKPPEVDTCDLFLAQLKTTVDETDVQRIQNEKKSHLEDAEGRYNLKSSDTKSTKENRKHKVLTADLQKCLPTPMLTNSLTFYKRKLWTMNYTIFDSSDNSAWCMMWDESKGKRGGNELASAMVKWADLNIPGSNVEHITLWSDNCYGQNKNSSIITAFYFILNKYPKLQTIDQKFLLKGHSHKEADTVHAQIEKQRKKTPTMTIVTPWDWQQFIRQCSPKYKVINLEVTDFKNVESLYSLPKGSTNAAPFIARKINRNKQPFLISKSVHLQYIKDQLGILYYKTSFQAKDFDEIDLRRNARAELTVPTDLQQINQRPVPISTAKYKDIMDLLPFVPSEFHEFYRSLSHAPNRNDYPEGDYDQ